MSLAAINAQYEKSLAALYAKRDSDRNRLVAEREAARNAYNAQAEKLRDAYNTKTERLSDQRLAGKLTSDQYKEALAQARTERDQSIAALASTRNDELARIEKARTDLSSYVDNTKAQLQTDRGISVAEFKGDRETAQALRLQQAEAQKAKERAEREAFKQTPEYKAQQAAELAAREAQFLKDNPEFAAQQQQLRQDTQQLQERVQQLQQGTGEFAPLSKDVAPEANYEYYLQRSTVPREEALREADRILQKYPITDPTARDAIANLAQVYGIAQAERQLGGIYSQEGIDLNKYAIDTSTPQGKAAAERNAAEAAMVRSISAFQPTTPTFDFAAQTQQPFTPQTQQFQFQPQGTFQPGFQPQFQGPAARPLIAQAERPTLDQTVQFIESGGMSPGAGALPMQPITYGELASFAPQAQSYFPVQPTATDIGQMGLAQLTPTQALPVTAGTYYDYAAPGTPPAMMREGGSVAQEARGLAALGRGGDNVMVHMSPEEVAGLRALAMQQGTDLTINPETGMPEAFKLKKLFKAALPIVAAVAAPYLAGVIPGISGAALAGGLAGVGTMLGGGKLKEGIMAGLGAYGSAALTSNAMGKNPLGVGGQQSTFNVANTFGTAAPKVAEGMGGVSTSGAGVTFDPESLAAVPQQAAAPIQQAALTPPPTQGTKIFGMSPSTALLGGTMVAGLVEGQKEREMFERQEAERQAEEDRRRRLGLAAFQRSLGQVPMAAGGGLVALAQGGMPTYEYGGTTGPTNEPRMVKGAGDGMSDNVPATIEGVQEARLANDEFVIPADVVADIGNGSSSSGAQKLYSMMDRIRKARHGTTEQPPEIDAEKYMPA